MENVCLIGIDVGTSGVKVLALSPEGRFWLPLWKATLCIRPGRAGPNRILPTGGPKRSSLCVRY
jgi:hypothetical protein